MDFNSDDFTKSARFEIEFYDQNFLLGNSALEYFTTFKSHNFTRKSANRENQTEALDDRHEMTFKNH